MADHAELYSFLQSEFETTAEYMSHVEDKLANVLTFYSTLLFGVVSACSYIATGELFAKTHFLNMAPRALFIGVATGLFTAIGILHLGIYTELRVTKVRALEQMALVRSHFAALAKSFGMDLGQAVGTPSAVSACPRFLERPSDDWYTLVLMTLVNAVAVAVYIGSLLFGVWPGWFSVHRAELAVISSICLLFPAYTQFRWITLRCFILDCQREAIHGPSIPSKVREGSFAVPFVLRWVEPLAAKIERAHKHAIMTSLGARQSTPNTAAGQGQTKASA